MSELNQKLQCLRNVPVSSLNFTGRTLHDSCAFTFPEGNAVETKLMISVQGHCLVSSEDAVHD